MIAVNRQQPTAELRPQVAEQTDEDDLMPYDLLDAIEDHAIGEKRSPAEDAGSPLGRILAIRPGPLCCMDSPVLRTLEPQSVEAGAVRPLVPCR